MVNNLGKNFGIFTLIGFFICNGFFKVSTLKCYRCYGEEACKKENLGKTGNAPAYPNGREQTYGTTECEAGENQVPGSEYCITMSGDHGIFERGCFGVPTNEAESFDKSNLTNCHLEDGSNWARQKEKLPCLCFTDFCNGDPPNCCNDADGNW